MTTSERYILHNFDPAPKHFFRNASMLEQTHAVDARTGEEVAVPDVDILTAGIPCVDESSLNQGGRKTRKGFRKGKGATGKCWKHLKGYVTKHKPKIVVVENVRGLQHKVASASSSTSALDSITNDMAELGYVHVMLPMDAVESFLPQTRYRIYLVFVRNDVQDIAAQPLSKFGVRSGCLQTFADGVLDALKGYAAPLLEFLNGLDKNAPVLPDTLDEFDICVPERRVRQMTTRANHSKYSDDSDDDGGGSDSASSSSSSVEQKCVDWLDRHKKYYLDHDMRWPSCLPAAFFAIPGAMTMIRGLSPRQLDALSFHIKRHGACDSDIPMVFDLSQGIHRLPFDLDKSPCVCPNSILVLVSSKVVHLLTAEEMLKLQGVFIDEFDKPLNISAGRKRKRSKAEAS
jgi:site-specific DNA-cytosine methylase